MAATVRAQAVGHFVRLHPVREAHSEPLDLTTNIRADRVLGIFAVNRQDGTPLTVVTFGPNDYIHVQESVDDVVNACNQALSRMEPEPRR